MTTSYGVLSTYPPTQCGLATFSAALVESLQTVDHVISVVALVDAVESRFAPEVQHQWVRGQAGGVSAAAARLNAYDIVIVQHEYGIFAGPDGSEVMDVVRALSVPIISVFHTVLAEPTLRQRTILIDLAMHSQAVITMTLSGRKRLIDDYGVDPSKITVIAHGAEKVRIPELHSPIPTPNRRPVILTWGLLSGGKGIEWAIAAMAELRDLNPTPRYRIVGQTHPKVIEWEGEKYRDGLEAEVRRLEVDDLVSFDARYLTTAELHRIVQEADIVLLPYDSLDQVTSGVLVEAVTAGKPVVSTRFPHAVELLADGVGLLVDRQSPQQIAAALRRLLTDPSLVTQMSDQAKNAAPDLLWSAVADRYRSVAMSLLEPAAMSVGA